MVRVTRMNEIEIMRSEFDKWLDFQSTHFFQDESIVCENEFSFSTGEWNFRSGSTLNFTFGFAKH